LISISLHNLGKKFGREWIFRQVNLEIAPGERLAVLGGNGSGKSTVIQVMAGAVASSEGSTEFSMNGKVLEAEEMTRHISFASPYLQLIEDMSLPELIEHIGLFKPFLNNSSAKEIVQGMQLAHTGNKLVRHFSSGMQQRVRIALALMADTQVVFLDEPHSNFDLKAIEWYRGMISDFAKDRSIIVCSNSVSDEYFFCRRSVDLAGFKPVAR